MSEFVPMVMPSNVQMAPRRGRPPKGSSSAQLASLEENLKVPVFDPESMDEKDVTTLPCPYVKDGKVQLRAVGEQKFWMGVGPFYTTRLFPFKRELIWFLCQRPWQSPGFPPNPKVEVRDITEPVPAHLTPEGDKRAKDVRVQAQVDEFIERNKTRLGLRK